MSEESKKPRKYGGAPTRQGLELFAKLAVTAERLRICDVLVGSGTVPDDVYIGDLEALIEPMGIGTCSEPVRDGATVNMTVECRSDLNRELENGMTIREFLIRAWDGEEKIGIYYGCLADYPQYIAPWEEGYLDVRRYPVSIRLAPSVDVELDSALPSVVMTLDDIKDYCITTLLPQLLTSSQNQIVLHNQAAEAHPLLQEGIVEAKEAAALADAKAAAAGQAAAAAAERAGGCAVELTFAPGCAGQAYTVTDGAGETHTGTVPEDLKAAVTVRRCSTVYTVTTQDADGNPWENKIITGPYFGSVAAAVSSFSATLAVTTSPLARVTAVCGTQVYAAQADAEGAVALAIGLAGTYTVTAALEGKEASGTVAVTESGNSYAVTLETFVNGPGSGGAGSGYYREFEAEDWSSAGEIRIPQTEHGMAVTRKACACRLLQRADRTALDYYGASAAAGRTAITNAVAAALSANASAAGTYPTAEDGHPQLTWNQVQYYILYGSLVANETASAAAQEHGFDWQDRDTTGAVTTLTLDDILASAYLPALGGVSTGLDALCTAEVLQGLRLRRKADGVGDVETWELEGELIPNGWGAISTAAAWDLDTGDLVLRCDDAYAGAVLVSG